MCLGIPMLVIGIEGTRAIVETGGATRDVDATFVRPRPGDFVYVQHGIVIEVLDPAEARQTLDAISEVG